MSRKTFKPRPCRIEGCKNLEKIQWHGRGWRRGVLCHAHRRRKLLYGSPTARKCVECHQVVDDPHEETEKLGGRFVCSRCLIVAAEARDRLRLAKAQRTYRRRHSPCWARKVGS